MDDNQKEQDEIQRGFNAGYTLQAKAPDLAKQYGQLLDGRNDGYAVGLKAGIKEMQAEKERSISKFKTPDKNRNFLKRPAKSRGKNDRGKSMDKG